MSNTIFSSLFGFQIVYHRNQTTGMQTSSNVYTWGEYTNHYDLLLVLYKMQICVVFWGSLLVLLVIVMSVTHCYSFWPLWCLLLIVCPFGHCDVCYSLFVLLAIVMSVTHCLSFWPLWCLLLTVCPFGHCNVCYSLFVLLVIVMSVTHNGQKHKQWVTDITMAKRTNNE
jgi:hypothetical protein